MRIQVSIVLLMLIALTSLHSQEAETIFIHARVWTADSSRPAAEAVAVAGGKILAVGSDAEVRAKAGSGTRIVDCGGRRMVPGLIDDHTHFMGGGFQLQSVDLRNAGTKQEFASLIGKRAARYPGRWITGGDWDHDNWHGGSLPDKSLIDSLTRNTPVFVSRYDGHMALANSAALKIAGITKATPDPPGGTIVHDPVTGEPTGVLKDEAMSAVWLHVPDPSEEEMVDAARLALAEARRFGLTSIQDVSSRADVRVYKRLQQQGELTARMHCRLPIGTWKGLADSGITVPSGDQWLRIGSLKAFADGSLGSSTALFCAPYDSDPSTRGLATDILMDGRLEAWATAADAKHLQLSIHAIGDSANGLMLDMFGRIAEKNGPWDRRFRIEHAQHIRPEDVARFARLGVIASVQPYHAIDDGRWAEGRIGHGRARYAYPFKSFLDAGTVLCFGSDWTVAPLNPLLGIYAAVTRRTTDGANPNGWFPEEKITVEQALKAYTINNAFAAFEESEKGSITAGKLADLVLLSDDILAMDPAGIKDVQVWMTVVGGTIVYGGKP